MTMKHTGTCVTLLILLHEDLQDSIQILSILSAPSQVKKALLKPTRDMVHVLQNINTEL